MNLTILFAVLFTSAHAAEVLPQVAAVRLGVRLVRSADWSKVYCFLEPEFY